ncbi:hypothetical protein BH09ACT8_BH09ACT8_35210 [soil metagenome]
MARTERRQRPHSVPAPQASATALEVDAPAVTAAATVWLVTPTHRQTYIESGPQPAPSIFTMEENSPTNSGGYTPTPARLIHSVATSG